MPKLPHDVFARRILEQLLRLRAANALPLVETAPGRGIWRWGFRAAGQAVSVDLDMTVLCLRVYHARDEVAMSHIDVATMETLTGKRPVPAVTAKATEGECIAELRRIVADWRADNPRIYMHPPATAGHPDNWNGA